MTSDDNDDELHYSCYVKDQFPTYQTDNSLLDLSANFGKENVPSHHYKTNH